MPPSGGTSGPYRQPAFNVTFTMPARSGTRGLAWLPPRIVSLLGLARPWWPKEEARCSLSEDGSKLLVRIRFADGRHALHSWRTSSVVGVEVVMEGHVDQGLFTSVGIRLRLTWLRSLWLWSGSYRHSVEPRALAATLATALGVPLVTRERNQSYDDPYEL